jgi:hypothetical protein
VLFRSAMASGTIGRRNNQLRRPGARN